MIWATEMIEQLKLAKASRDSDMESAEVVYLRILNAALFDTVCSLAKIVHREFSEDGRTSSIKRYQAEYNAAMAIIMLVAGKESRTDGDS